MERGDIYTVDLDPTRGKDQRGRRPVLIITRAEFNAHNPPLVCPISSDGVGMRLAGFTVSLAATGLKTTGVVLCSQMRTLDIRERRGRRIERVPDEIMSEVLATLLDIIE